MSHAIASIYRYLSPLKIYALETGGMVDAELAAYNVAFIWIEERFARMERRAFAQTATEEDLADYEALVGLQRNPDRSTKERQDMVLYRLGVAPYAFTNGAIFRSLRACGISATVTEFPLQERMLLAITEYMDHLADLDQVIARLDSILPAHLDWELDYGHLTWAIFDAAEQQWNEWDTKDFTWNLFDNHGETLFPPA